MTTPYPPNPNYPPQPPRSGGMPKWLIILIVVLLIVGLGCCGGIATCWWAGSRMVDAAREEARRQGVGIDFTGAGVSLPASFPADLPVYSGFRAFVVTAPPGKSDGFVQFTGKADPKTVADYYKTELTSRGWTSISDNTSGDTRHATYRKNDLTVNLTISGDADDCMLGVSYAKSGTPPTPEGDDTPDEPTLPTPPTPRTPNPAARATPPTPPAPPTTPERPAARSSDPLPSPVGKLPTNFPTDVPIFSGLSPTPVSYGDIAQNSGMVALSGKVDRQKAVDFYTQELEKNGWKKIDILNAESATFMNYTKESRTLNLSISPGADKSETTVSILYGKE